MGLQSLSHFDPGNERTSLRLLLLSCFKRCVCFRAEDICDPDFPFTVLAREARELWLPSTIERIPVPSPLQFYSDYVAKNKPVIITGAVGSFFPAHPSFSTLLKRMNALCL